MDLHFFQKRVYTLEKSFMHSVFIRLIIYYLPLQVLVGSTHLLTPAETVQSVLCQNNVNQDDT